MSIGLKRHGYHILFGITLFFLAALVAWWALFIRSAVVQDRNSRYETLNARIDAQAAILGHLIDKRPATGPMGDALEIAECDRAASGERAASGGRAHPRSLAPLWPGLCLQAQSRYIEGIEERFRKRTAMVISESAFLFLLLGVGIFMLYRMIVVERRVAREMNEFFGRLTHEIKTPITAIKAFLQTLQSHEFDREQLKPLLLLALRQVERQEMLTENILVGQRIGRTASGVRVMRTDLGAYVADYLKTHRIILGDARVDFAPPAGGAVTVLADPDALRVVLENLTDNALKYGGDPLKLTIRIEHDAKRARLLFSDAGIGFEPAATERIFEAYRRLTDELPEGRHGTGLGLFLSRELCRKMKGDLTARSDGRGRGATFIVSLPVTNG